MTMRTRLSIFAWLLVCACLFASARAANLSKNDIVDRVGFDQRMNATLPLDAHFRDESGRDVRVGDYFDATPVVLVFAYYGCSTLCPTVIGDLAQKLEQSGLAPSNRYRVVVVSIDASDTPAIASSKKAAYLASASRPQADAVAKAWRLLTGNQTAIDALTQAAGFRAVRDSASDRSGLQFAHPAGIVVLTPRGAISRYFFGFDYTPSQLRAAIDDASAQRIASPIERLLMLCFHFDPVAGKNSAVVMQALRGMALAMLLAFVALLAYRRVRIERDRASADVE